MELFKNKFAEFKSIFFSEDLLKENEEHANIVTASTMLNLFWIFIIKWILTYFNILKVGLNIMNLVLIYTIILLLIPSIICYLRKGKGEWIKHYLFISFTVLLAIADMILKYNVTLVMVLPVILAARYYNKNFTLSIAIFTSILFIISTTFCINIGQQDLNSYNLIIPKGTTITIDKTLRDALSQIDVNESTRLRNIFIHFFLPKMLIFNIVAFACIQISQSGKKIIEKQVEITKANERTETELNLASAIQKNMLPSIFPPFPEHDEIDIYAAMIPAKKIGGDFYDMFLIDENHLAICMADVSGKGVPASLIMMITKILIKNVSKIDMDVSKTFTRVNKMLCDGNDTGLFITSWFGILDLKTGKIEFVNAGHNPPLLFSKKTNRFDFIKTKPNLVLAGMENTTYKKEELKIEKGDRIFLYTDGVVEANNINNELYTEERLQEFLNNHLDLNVEETINEVKKDIDNFAEGAVQFDDITMLELLYKESDSKKISQEFKAEKKELSNVENFVKETLENKKCDEKIMNQIRLAIEEIFINIASYAYKDKEGTCTLTIEEDNNNYSFIFQDEGIPFNPLEKENPDTSLSASKREVGGLGIFLTKSIMDDVKYKYENNKNILTLKIDTNNRR